MIYEIRLGRCRNKMRRKNRDKAKNNRRNLKWVLTVVHGSKLLLSRWSSIYSQNEMRKLDENI